MQEVKISNNKSRFHGIATVKLFDCYTGKLEYETQVHNTIYEDVYQYLEDYQWLVFCEGLVEKEPDDFDKDLRALRGHFTINDISLFNGEQPYLSTIDIFNYYGLEHVPFDRMVGWADKNSYAGTDNRRGSLNEELSYAAYDKIHFVFDWGTNAGNGTFDNIYWGSIATPKLYYESLINTYSSGAYKSGTPIACVGDYFYSLLYDGTILVISKQNYTLVRTMKADISTRADTGFGLTTDGQGLYAIDYRGYLYYLSLEGRIIWGPRYIGWDIDPRKGYTFGLGYGVVYLYALCGNTLIGLDHSGIPSLYWVDLDIPVYDGAGVDIESDGIYIYAMDSRGNFYKIDLLGKILFHSQMRQFGSLTEKVGLAYDGRYLYAMNSYGQMLKNINIKCDLFAHTILPTPITKTSSQTMRIEYDFIRG